MVVKLGYVIPGASLCLAERCGWYDSGLLKEEIEQGINDNMHIHILGICGTFMGSLAQLAKASGHRVSGSDTNVYPPMSTQLEKAGIELTEAWAKRDWPAVRLPPGRRHRSSQTAGTEFRPRPAVTRQARLRAS